MTVRLFLPALLAGILISLGLFWLMQFMLLNKPSGIPKTSDLKMVEFVRLKREVHHEPKQRRLPEKPPPEKRPPPPKVNLAEVNPVQTDMPDIAMPNLDIPLPSERFSGSITRGLEVGTGQPSGDVIPLMRIAPQYPMRAAMRRIEGWVRVEFIIAENGTVKDVEVVESSPSGVFDRAAVDAILKWKFKPKLLHGQPVEQRAIQTLEFKLSR